MTETVTELSATWSNWWGSPQLLARIVSVGSEQLQMISGEPPHTSVTFTDRSGNVETFPSIDQFLHRCTPEMLAGFLLLICEATTGSSAYMVSFERPKSLWTTSHSSQVKLLVSADLRTNTHHIGALIREISRGYRAFWGESSWSSASSPRTKYLRMGYVFRFIFVGLTCALMGAVFGSAVERIPTDPPSWTGIAAGVVGFLTVLVIDRGIPDVEIADRGRTRLMVLIRRVGATILGGLAAQALALVLGNT